MEEKIIFELLTTGLLLSLLWNFANMYYILELQKKVFPKEISLEEHFYISQLDNSIKQLELKLNKITKK